MIKSIRNSVLGAVVAAAGLAANPALADIIFTTSGNTSLGGLPVSGSATFKIVGSTFEVILDNTTASIGAIGQVLDGLTFTVVGGSGLTLTSASAAGGFLDCTTGTCTSVGTFHDYHNNTDPPSPYEWTYVAPLLSAGNGSWKPAGIVNTPLNGGLDGLSNTQHNDYLVGPVEFDFSFTTPPTNVTSALFQWGTTTGDTTRGTSGGGGLTSATIPEPGTLALLGLGLAGLAFKRRRSR